MKKGSGLRRRPEQARAWQERSRQRAIEREADTSAAPARSRGGKPTSAVDRVHFKPSISASGFPCDRCARLAREAIAAGARGREVPEVRPAVHWHHWLEQQHLKTYVLTLRLLDDDAARELKRLIQDRRNYSPVCVGCHGITGLEHGRAFEFVDVPPSAFAFASELGGEWLERLRRTYTGRES